MPWTGPQTDRCPRCNKSVYANEAKMADGVKWHIFCYKCAICNTLMESGVANEHEGQLYCRLCHGKKFGPKGYGFGGGSGCLSTDAAQRHGNTQTDMSVAPSNVSVSGTAVQGGCPRCGKRVYEAEKKIGAGGDWHKSCFNCKQCHASLDSSALTEREGEIYCKGCYGRLYGPKGVGFGTGSGALHA